MTGGMLQDGLEAHRAGRLDDAENAYRRVLSDDPRQVDALHLLGVLFHQQGRNEEALRLIDDAVSISPQPAILSNQGAVLRALGRLEEACTALTRAADLAPGEVEPLVNLGVVLVEVGETDEAVKRLSEAVRLAPAETGALNNLGIALFQAGRLDEAMGRFREAARLNPGDATAHKNMASVFNLLGRLDQAEKAYGQAVRLRPTFADAHLGLALTHLAQGRFATGWPGHEWRFAAGVTRLPSDVPIWRGEPGEGRTLLVEAEQGFGDTLQFCRYAPLVAARGWNVVLRVQPPLVRLLGQIDDALVVGNDAPAPPHDAQCAMMSLPLLCGTAARADIPSPIPLHAFPDDRQRWADRLGERSAGRPRVGLAWAGSGDPFMDRRRSIDPALLTPLFDLPVDLFSLQKGGAPAPADLPMIDLMAEVEDFADTAGLIENLDLVIAVDTAVAHLAATMAKPVWLLNRFDSCWRWLRKGGASPWYPTLRIYRQTQLGDWRDPVAAVVKDLKALAAGPTERRA